jgi:hypothetical protein
MTLVGAGIALVALAFALFMWGHLRRLKRAEFIRD